MNKQLLLLSSCIIFAMNVYAQNVGINTNTPTEKLSVKGNLLVIADVTSSASLPDAGHTYNISDTTRYVTDSVYRIYDPGGTGNYAPDMSRTITLVDTAFYGSGQFGGLELVFESIGLGTGDSIFIFDGSSFTIPVLKMGSNYNVQLPPALSSIVIKITFISNSDLNVGSGFSALVRRLFLSPAALQNANATNYGNSGLLFNSANGSLRSGIANNRDMGMGAVIFGIGSSAKGTASVALGSGSVANDEFCFAVAGGSAKGSYSLALGGQALKINSIALGRYSIADANYAAALTNYAYAYGENSTALGYGSRAYGIQSIALLGGLTNIASSYGLAIGNGASSGNLYDVAIGKNAVADGGSALALGENTSAGPSAVAIGKNSYATNNSFAFGNTAAASGYYSTAIGRSAGAYGISSVSIGENTNTNGYNTVAIGKFASAAGNNAIAIGSNITANGNYSMALGNYVSTSNFEGCLTIGDNSTTTVMNTFIANGFRSRFAGGYRLFTNSAANVGAFLNANANSWAALSDVRLKENFIPVNGESVLKSIAAMPQYTWNYKGQDAKTLRHYGPMAQDFYKAFGHDDLGEIGCDTLINQQDFLGVNLIAIQALEKRTTDLQNELSKAMEIISLQLKRIEMLEEKNKNLSTLKKSN